jgi:hypothetical protein
MIKLSRANGMWIGEVYKGNEIQAIYSSRNVSRVIDAINTHIEYGTHEIS